MTYTPIHYSKTWVELLSVASQQKLPAARISARADTLCGVRSLDLWNCRWSQSLELCLNGRAEPWGNRNGGNHGRFLGAWTVQHQTLQGVMRLKAMTWRSERIDIALTVWYSMYLELNVSKVQYIYIYMNVTMYCIHHVKWCHAFTPPQRHVIQWIKHHVDKTDPKIYILWMQHREGQCLEHRILKKEQDTSGHQISFEIGCLDAVQ